MVNEKVLAVIPARGGSKRIPLKNIYEFKGKPMIAWTIEAALESGVFHEVIVSTDDEKIAQISKKYGASVPFLRDDFYDDFTPVSHVTVDVLSKLSANYEIVVQLMPNCPLRNSKDISNSLERFINSNTNFQISCFKYGWMNPHWAHKVNNDFEAAPIFDSFLSSIRSQDLDELYCPSGAIWIAKVRNLLIERNFYGKRYSFFPLDWANALDIDDIEDLKMAEIAFNLRNESSKKK